MNLREAVTYPTNEDEWLSTMGIGTVLELLTFLVIPQLILQGYYVRVMRQTLDGNDEPPTFTKWSELLKDGILATIIILLYQLVPIVAFVVILVPSLLAMLQGDQGLVAGLMAILGGILFTGLLVAVFGYAAAAGLVAFAHKDSLKAAFSPGLLPVLASWEYLLAHLGVVTVTLGAILVKLVIGVIPVVNLLLVVVAPFLIEYIWVVWARLWATAYADVLDIAPDSDSAIHATPA